VLYFTRGVREHSTLKWEKKGSGGAFFEHSTFYPEGGSLTEGGRKPYLHVADKLEKKGSVAVSRPEAPG